MKKTTVLCFLIFTLLFIIVVPLSDIAAAPMQVELNIKFIKASQSKNQNSIPWGSSITFAVSATTNGNVIGAFDENEEYWTVSSRDSNEPNIFIKQWNDKPQWNGTSSWWNPIKYIKIYAPFGQTQKLTLTSHSKYQGVIEKNVNVDIIDGTNITGKYYYKYNQYSWNREKFVGPEKYDRYPEIFDKIKGTYKTKLPNPSIFDKHQLWLSYAKISSFVWNDKPMGDDKDFKPGTEYSQNVDKEESVTFFSRSDGRIIFCAEPNFDMTQTGERDLSDQPCQPPPFPKRPMVGRTGINFILLVEIAILLFFLALLLHLCILRKSKDLKVSKS